MSQSEMQACLARLYVDAAFRRLFLLEPDRTLARYRLTPPEATAIAEIDRDQLERFARSLRLKAERRYRSVYPRTFAVRPEAGRRHFELFYDLHPQLPYEAPSRAIHSFGRFMAAAVARDDDYPAYAADLAFFEQAIHVSRVEAGDPQPSALADMTPDARPRRSAGHHSAVLGHDLLQISTEIDNGAIPTGAETGTFCYLFTAGRAVPIAPLERSLLEQCDGRRRARELAAGVATARVQRALERLVELGAVTA